MTSLLAVARGVRIFALLTRIPPGQQTTIPRTLLEGALVPGGPEYQTPEFIVDFFHHKLKTKFNHIISYDDKTRTWTFFRPKESEDLQ